MYGIQIQLFALYLAANAVVLAVVLAYLRHTDPRPETGLGWGAVCLLSVAGALGAVAAVEFVPLTAFLLFASLTGSLALTAIWQAARAMRGKPACPGLLAFLGAAILLPLVSPQDLW